MKKIFLFSALAFLFVFFSCQKEKPISPQTAKEGVISSRSSVTPEDLAQNKNFKMFIDNVVRTIRTDRFNVSNLSPGELSTLKEISNDNTSQEEMNQALNILGTTEESFAHEIFLILNPLNSLLLDYPELKEKSKSELNEIIRKAGDLYIEEIAKWISSIDGGGVILGDEIPNYGDYEHYILFGCGYNWTVHLLDGTSITCPNYYVCLAEWSIDMNTLWTTALKDFWNCTKDFLDVSDWITYAGAAGGVLTWEIGGIGAVPASVIGGILGIIVNIPEAQECADAGDQAFSDGCAAAIAAANDCCGW